MKETGGCFEVGSALRADLVVSALGRDDRPGHPRARGPHAPTLWMLSQGETGNRKVSFGHAPANHPLSNLTKNNELRTKNVNTPLLPPLSFASTVQLILWASGPLVCPHVPVSPCPLAPSWRFAPSCPLALALYFCAGAPKIPPLAIVTILKSPPEAETQRR